LNDFYITRKRLCDFPLVINSTAFPR